MTFGDPIPRLNPNILPLPMAVKTALPELGSLMARQNLTAADALTNYPHGLYGYLLPRIIKGLEQITLVNSQDLTDAIGGREYDFIIGARSKQDPTKTLLIKGSDAEISLEDVEIEDEFINRFPDNECVVIHYHPSGLLMRRSRSFFSETDILNQLKMGVRRYTQVLVTQHSGRLWIIRPISQLRDPKTKSVSLNQTPRVDNPNDLRQLKLLSRFLFEHDHFLYSCFLDDRERKLNLITG